MDKKTIEQFKEKLLLEKEKLQKDLDKVAKKEDGEYEVKFQDIGRTPEENAEEIEEYTSNLGVTDALEKNLKEVNEALERIEKGIYGKCENCGGEIPLARLQAYPAASHCLVCVEDRRRVNNKEG